MIKFSKIKHLKNIPIEKDEVEQNVDFLHLANHKLSDGNFFKFIPQIPKTPARAEDNFTPRISVGKTFHEIEKAKDLFQSSYVYAVAKNSNVKSISCAERLKKCKKEIFYYVTYNTESEPEKREYELRFNTHKYIEHLLGSLKYSDILTSVLGLNEKDILKLQQLVDKIPADLDIPLKDLPEPLKKRFKGCVPDADMTNEYWILEPVTVFYVGKYGYDKKIYLSDYMTEKLKNILSKRIKKSQR